jgi:hypothetical protein
MFLSISLVPLYAFLALSAPLLVERQSATTCGSDRYTSAQINAAANAACNYVTAGSTAGGSTYPHVYHNYEGFDFGGKQGPFYEFPILESGVYTGRKFRIHFKVMEIRDG